MAEEDMEDAPLTADEAPLTTEEAPAARRRRGSAFGAGIWNPRRAETHRRRPK